MVSGGTVGVALIHMNVMTECSTSAESTPTPVTEISDESACSDDLPIYISLAQDVPPTLTHDTLFIYKNYF